MGAFVWQKEEKGISYMDLTSSKDIRNIANMFGFSFKKGLGQNFLTDRTVLEDIAEAAGGAEGIIEIGPGFGVLTQELAENFEKVVAIETDESLKSVLAYTLSDYKNVEVVWGDVLKTNLSELIDEKFQGMKVSVAANLPYYVTTPIITELVTKGLPVSDIVIMIQKEVAERICAKPGTKSYGALSVMCQYYTNPELVTTVKADCFVPAPKVDSAVVKMSVCEKPNVLVEDEAFFFKTVQAAFSQRRKTLLNCLCGYFKCNKEKTEMLLNEIEIDPKRRGETLSLEDFAKLSERIKDVI